MDKRQKIGTAIAIGGTAAGIAISACLAHDKALSVSGRGQTALITGASSGIGREFARIFAARDFNLVLTARSEEKLNRLAEELRQSYGVGVAVIPADLSLETEPERLYREVAERGIHVDQLVNNAGAGKVGDVIDIDPQVMEQLIHLNVSSVTMLCHYFGSAMRAKGSGRILNVSSLGAFIPDPHFNVYGPTKAYELFLTEALSGELKGSGVTVSCLCPGPTKTNWATNAGKADSKAALNPADVARIGFEGMQRGELVIVPTALFKTERAALGLLPAKVQVGIIETWQRHLIAGGKHVGA